jgi:RNase P subunit RPR2
MSSHIPLRRDCRRVTCPACASTEWPGMQLKSGRSGRQFWSPCHVCQGGKRIILLQPKALAPDVMGMLLLARKEAA